MERYIRVRKIGEGSFGKALLVKKKNDGKHYVIKEINICRMKPKEREESRKEVKVLSQLKHPNIVTYKESFEETGNLYIVMDYCDGGDLYKKINGQRGLPFPEDQVMDWFVQLALGMKHVHDRKILHRDIKSQNIFLTRNGIVKLGDFGIARVLHSTVELARTCIGTPYYLSPEIVENRPYNNKSDIWSMGCVLYEMLTLKHAFEAGNMKNLVLKIIRGSYPPIPIRYGADVRLLVSQLLKRNPHDRPSVNTILKKNFIQKRIQKFLSQEVIEDEFSHTVLHRKPFGVQGQRPLPARPLPAKPAAVPKFSEPKAKYGVSVARKKPKKPSSGGDVAKKPAPVNVAKPADKKKELDARERRRRELVNQQDQQYNQHMKKVQQQRWERQQRDQINKDRDQAWKSTMSVGLSPDKGHVAASNQQAVVSKDPNPMNKYQRPVSAREQKENIPEPVKPERPVSAYAPSHRNPAMEAARQGNINRAYGAEAAERARVKEEFLNRKREAARNKLRGHADYGGYEYKPPLQPKANNANNAEQPGRNKSDQDYLARLEAIRRQNYAERREIQNRMAGIRGPAKAKKEDVVAGDPRYDPEARKKKIAALKMQAEERAAMLRKQLDEKKKAVLDKLNRAGKERWEEEQKKMKPEEKPRGNDRVFIPARRAVEEEKPAVAAVGLETALKQVGLGTLYRSNSENDLLKLSKEESEEPSARKQWGNIPFQPRILPLEVTASHMEATSAADVVIKPGEANNQAARKQWGQQKTQVVSALEKIKLQTATCTIIGNDESDASRVGQTITVSKAVTPSSPGIGKTITVGPSNTDIGQTITVSNQSTSSGLPVVGGTVTMTPASPSSPQTVVLKKDPLNTLKEEDEEKKEPVQAWENKPTSPKVSGSPTKPDKEEDKTKSDTTRVEYDKFLKSSREEQKSPQQPPQQPLFNKVEPKENKSSGISDDLQVEEFSIDESSFHTADGSPDTDSRTNLLKTGIYDTNSRRLRTCSMPDLRLIFATPNKDSDDVKDEDNNEDDNDDNDDDENIDDDDNGDDDDNDDDDDDDNVDDGDDEFNDDEDEEELEGSANDEEDADEYENMLASMRDVLVSSARSPSPMKAAGTAQSMEWDPCADTKSPNSDDADGPAEGRSSELSNLNEDWDSGEGEDDDDDKEEIQDDDEDNSVFQRLEESRQALEQELGFDRFLRVYRYLQTIQENEDEDDNVSSSSDEISELLGDKEHLYPKILYLVIADSAYSEENQ